MSFKIQSTLLVITIQLILLLSIVLSENTLVNESKYQCVCNYENGDQIKLFTQNSFECNALCNNAYISKGCEENTCKCSCRDGSVKQCSHQAISPNVMFTGTDTSAGTRGSSGYTGDCKPYSNDKKENDKAKFTATDTSSGGGNTGSFSGSGSSGCYNNDVCGSFCPCSDSFKTIEIYKL